MMCACSTVDDLNGHLLTEYEQLRVNAAASQMPDKQHFEAVYINNAGHQFAGRRTDLAHQTYPRMATFSVRAEPANITLFDLATRQGKTAQGGGCAADKHCHSCIRQHALPTRCMSCSSASGVCAQQ
jgi:hypothetical protein